MAKTIKEIADELGVDKQKVYRYIKKNRINEVHHEALQKNSVKQYDEAAETLIKQGILQESVSSEALHEAHQKHINEAVFDTVSDAVIDMLRKELEIKNEQIRELNSRLAESNAALVAAQQTAQAAQALHAGMLQQQLTSGTDQSEPRVDEPKKQGWFGRWFRGSERTRYGKAGTSRGEGRSV